MWTDGQTDRRIDRQTDRHTTKLFTKADKNGSICITEIYMWFSDSKFYILFIQE
jgi:hypothetical protein